MAGHSAQQQWSFPSHLTADPLGPWAPWLCYTTRAWHRLFSLKFHLPLLSAFITAAAITNSTGSACIPYCAQADVDPSTARVGEKGRRKRVLPPPHQHCLLGAHPPSFPPSLPPTDLAVAKPHVQSTLSINITNAISGSACSYSLRMVSVSLFRFTGTCRQEHAFCSLLPFVLFPEVWARFSSEVYKRVQVCVMD